MPKLFRPYYRDRATGERRQLKKYYAKVRDADAYEAFVECGDPFDAEVAARLKRLVHKAEMLLPAEDETGGVPHGHPQWSTGHRHGQHDQFAVLPLDEERIAA